MIPEDRLILAADTPEPVALDALCTRLQGSLRWIKVGSMLFMGQGPAIVRHLSASGWKVFLDLKLHDIPHQVGATIRQFADLGVSLTTVHLAGGPAMLAAAQEAAHESGIRLLGVTVLTSLDRSELARTGIDVDPEVLVDHRAAMAASMGIHGVVASAHEAARIRAAHPDFEIVTPGIRPAGTLVGDQRRVATPREALTAGATRLVIGRPITESPNPLEVVNAILKDIADSGASL